MRCIAVPYLVDPPLADAFLMANLLFAEGMKGFDADRAFAWLEALVTRSGGSPLGVPPTPDPVSPTTTPDRVSRRSGHRYERGGELRGPADALFDQLGGAAREQVGASVTEQRAAVMNTSLLVAGPRKFHVPRDAALADAATVEE